MHSIIPYVLEEIRGQVLTLDTSKLREFRTALPPGSLECVKFQDLTPCFFRIEVGGLAAIGEILTETGGGCVGAGGLAAVDCLG